MDVRWTTAFLDTPRGAPGAAASLALWLRVTGSMPSARRGQAHEFLTLDPPDGAAYLRWQDTASGGPSAHLDLHVDDLAAATGEVRAAGATVLSALDDVRVLRSPAGAPFCLVPYRGERRRPAAVTGASGAAGLVDQLCLDVPAEDFAAELRWWERLTGWPVDDDPDSELVPLRRAAGMPLRLLVQRLGGEDLRTAASWHVDLSATDARAVVGEHQAAGAVSEGRGSGWTVLRDPSGRRYCVTDRHPVSGP